MEKTAGMIIFRKKWFDRQYLVLQHATVDKYWGLAKGHIEKGENDEQAAIREVQEETGLNEIKIIPHFKEKTSYFFVSKGKKTHKEVIWFWEKLLVQKKLIFQ
ncbi:NUDIX domain-containing protein [Candidatus Woesearchaeota archaeon]|nr:NUDIX domain-containing protein [Candidatus Woesearchaeota archaeon]